MRRRRNGEEAERRRRRKRRINRSRSRKRRGEEVVNLNDTGAPLFQHRHTLVHLVLEVEGDGGGHCGGDEDGVRGGGGGHLDSPSVLLLQDQYVTPRPKTQG